MTDKGLYIGRNCNLDVTLKLSDMENTHMVFEGCSGSGKTSEALCVSKGLCNLGKTPLLFNREGRLNVERFEQSFKEIGICDLIEEIKVVPGEGFCLPLYGTDEEISRNDYNRDKVVSDIVRMFSGVHTLSTQEKDEVQAVVEKCAPRENDFIYRDYGGVIAMGNMLKKIDTRQSNNAYNKFDNVFSSNMFRHGELPFVKGKINIINLNELSVEAQREFCFFLINALYIMSCKGYFKEFPLYICADDFGDLTKSEESILGNILSRGRSANLNLMYITQEINFKRSNSKNAFLTGLKAAGIKMLFNIGGDVKIATALLGGKTSTRLILDVSYLKKGQYIVSSPGLYRGPKKCDMDYLIIE